MSSGEREARSSRRSAVPILLDRGSEQPASVERVRHDGALETASTGCAPMARLIETSAIRVTVLAALSAIPRDIELHLRRIRSATRAVLAVQAQ